MPPTPKRKLLLHLDIFVHDNSESNIYFTAALNERLKQHAFRTDADYVLALTKNADALPDPIGNLVAFLECKSRRSPYP